MVSMLGGLRTLITAYVLASATGDIVRDENKGINVEFIIVTSGRRYTNVLMIVEEVNLQTCLIFCVQHLQCNSINYNKQQRYCEVCADDVDDSKEYANAHGWWSYGTPQKVDGGWGNWTHDGVCSQTCGIGIQKEKRECNNPKPQYGGKKCDGESNRMTLCNHNKPCPDTCKTILERNKTTCMKTLIEIDGRRESITCKKENDNVYLMFGHDQEAERRFRDVSGAAAKLVIGYYNTISFIQRAIQQSVRCVQKFYVTSKNQARNEVLFTTQSGVSFNAESYIECIGCQGVFVNDNIEQTGSAYVEDKSLLPLKQVEFQDADTSEKYVYITMEKLKCEERGTEELVT